MTIEQEGWFPERQEKQEAYATKLSIIGMFLAVFVAFISQFWEKEKERQIDLWDWTLLGISTFRMGRLISYDEVIEPLRQPVARNVPHESGPGETVRPRGSGAQRVFGELVSCPICAGTWIAAGLTYALHLIPGPTRVFMTMMSATGVAEVLNSITEALSWTGKAARARTDGA